MLEFEPGYKDIDLGPTLALIRNMPPRDEYNNLISINHRDCPPISWTHELILDSEPLHVRQYCRTMTLAQGRILYQLWDDYEPWHPRHCGYIVPNFIATEARMISTKDRREDWKGLHPMKIRRYEDAWDAVVKAWPGIPIFGARRVVEELANMRIGGGKYDVEIVDKAVVRYARRYWTSYKAKLDSKGVNERNMASNWKVVKEIEEQVAWKLREVLGRWTRPGVKLGLDFLEHFGLVDKPAEQESAVQSSVQYRRFS